LGSGSKRPRIAAGGHIVGRKRRSVRDRQPSARENGRHRLNGVTVVAADCVRPDLAARALERCLEQCSFDGAVLFSDVVVPGTFRSEIIAPLRSLADYSAFCLREMPARVTTRFVLIVQWDGYVVDGDRWGRDFMRYDYIGALTPAVPLSGGWIVGNGGFSLRSRRLLALLPALPLVPGVPEDYLICQTFRRQLERDSGIRFAPPEVAERFSFGQRRSAFPTFGFHGIENLHRVESDVEVLRLFDRLTAAELNEGRLFPPIIECLKDGRSDLAGRLFERARIGNSRVRLAAIAARALRSETEAGELIARLETIVGAD
jgi:hypothetical protein